MTDTETCWLNDGLCKGSSGYIEPEILSYRKPVVIVSSSRIVAFRNDDQFRFEMYGGLLNGTDA